MNKNITVIIVTAIVIGSGSFYGGMVYAQNKAAAGSQGGFANLSPQEREARLAQRGTGSAGGMRMRNGGGFTAGQIISKDDKSITLKLQDGGSKIVFFASTTQVMKSTQGSSQDLTVGQEAVVTGSANQDGSVSAQSIQLRPVSVKI